MQIEAVRLENYRPFGRLQETKLGHLATLVGKNDSGKSSILFALEQFFDDKARLDPEDVHQHAAPDQGVLIECVFGALPDVIEIEEGVPTNLEDEMLLDCNRRLRIKKLFPPSGSGKPDVFIIAEDFEEDQYAALTVKKEAALNTILERLGLEYTKSGRGITNADKRRRIRDAAREAGVEITLRDLEVSGKSDLWKCISAVLPKFQLFHVDTRLGVSETSFQSQFRPIIDAAAASQDAEKAREAFEGTVRAALQEEIDEVYFHLKEYTDALSGLKVQAEFTWQKAVSFDVLAADYQHTEKALDRRGSGMRRLLMVAFFQYLAKRAAPAKGNYIFGIEEPENCLHPGLQRQLVGSFRSLGEKGYQVIVTSHSPVFAGASPLEDLVLITREGGRANGLQGDGLNREQVAQELGVEPADQVTGYDACVFVEGTSDAFFLFRVASVLKRAGEIPADFKDRNIGFVPIGGCQSLRFWTSQRALKRISRRYAVVIDSDRKAAEASIPQHKLNWKSQCEGEGAPFFILRKREMENYLHADAMRRKKGWADTPFDDFTDMKSEFGPNVVKAVGEMTAEEILDRDLYTEDGQERHELKEIVRTIINLPVQHTDPD